MFFNAITKIFEMQKVHIHENMISMNKFLTFWEVKKKKTFISQQPLAQFQ